MKLKKLLASCVLIAAMGITLTGCDLDIKGIVDEINSVVNDESSRDTDYGNSHDTNTENSSTDNGNSSDTNTENSSDSENSTDTNTEEPKTGTWVQTETRYFAYKNGEERYVSKQNEYYKYRCYYRGVTEDNFVKFQVSGGYYDYSGDSKKNSTCDAYHLCSVPETSYPAGGLVTLNLKNYEENVINKAEGGGSYIELKYEDKEADGLERHPFFHSSRKIDPYSVTQQEYTIWLGGGKSDTFTVKMPEEAEIGDRIAILFSGTSAYDSWSSAPQDDYGGYVWYAWIYTFTK